MAQTASSSRYHLLPEERPSIDLDAREEDAREDERLLASVEREESPLNGGQYSFHPTFWMRLLSILFCLVSFLILVKPAYQSFIPTQVFLMFSLVRNIMVLIWPYFDQHIQLSVNFGSQQGTASTSGTRPGKNKKLWWWLNFCLDAAIIFAAVIAIIVVCVSSWPRYNWSYCNGTKCYNYVSPVGELYRSAIIIACVALVFYFFGIFDGGHWPSIKILFRKSQPKSYILELRIVETSHQEGFPTLDPSSAPEQPTIKFRLPLCIFLRIVNIVLLILAIIFILQPGFRSHDALVTFLIFMLCRTICSLAGHVIPKVMRLSRRAKSGRITLPVETGEEEGFKLKFFGFMLDIFIVIGALISWQVSISDPSPGRGRYLDKAIIAWLSIALVCIITFMIYSLDALNPVALVATQSGDPNDPLTWRVTSRLNYGDDKPASATLSS